MIPGAPENKRMTQPIDPISPFSIENKMGFAPVLHCVCGASLDTGKVKRSEIARFKMAHRDCQPA